MSEDYPHFCRNLINDDISRAFGGIPVYEDPNCPPDAIYLLHRNAIVVQNVGFLAPAEEVKEMKHMPSQAVRAYIYRVLIVVGPLLAFYGVASDAEIALWLAVAAQFLGVGLAAANTPRN